ncbi:MAG: hypothetical protein U0638_13685 [Phycisphaerales bacterium]
MKFALIGVAAVGVLAIVCPTSVARAQPWSFTKIVDSNTSIPGTATLKFDGANSFQYVSVYADRVAFLGQAKSGNGYGVYEWQSGVGRTIANKNTVVPGGTTKIQVYHEINATSRGVTFYAAAPDNSGVFYEDGTSLGHVADRMDSIPDGSGKFTGIEFRHHSVGTSTAFAGRNDASGQPFGIYRSDDGVLTRIADKTMSPPGHAELFEYFLDWRVEGEATYISAFTATTYGGIFRSQGGVLTKIVDSNDLLPDGHRIVSTQYIRPAGENMVFNGFIENHIEGIYIKTPSGLDRLVDELMTPPDGSSDTYKGIGDFDYQNGTLIFKAGNEVMYTNYGGTMQRLIGPGDVLDGKQVLSVNFYEHGFDGTTAAFWVVFEGDSSFFYNRAIYTVTIPAPGAAGLVFSCTMLALGRRRRAV